MKHETPLYAVIPFFGGEWSVVYSAHPENVENHASHTGYGEFPSDKFPGIPVIDLRQSRTLKGFIRHLVSEAYQQQYSEHIPLARYLEICETDGATVYYS